MTAKQHIENQINDTDNYFVIDPGKFAESTIRKAAAALGFNCFYSYCMSLPRVEIMRIPRGGTRSPQP